MTQVFFTSESVTEGHPDKLADQISDAILDNILTQDPNGRVACETLLTRGTAVVAGEITTDCYVKVSDIVRETINSVGYTHTDYGFDGDTCGVLSAIQEQSPDISMGVDQEGAGDQGMMFGYATNETPEFMPAPIMLCHKLAKRLADVRRNKQIPELRPDGKSQVTVEYHNGKPVRVTNVLLAAQHDPDIKEADLKQRLIDLVIHPSIPKELADPKMKILINSTGRFVIGGPQADTGLTGRKIIVDTYGGMAHHGGGCFSGKDPTKVDRSGSYMMRWVAKNIVAAGLADKCELEVAYAIGQAEPFSILVDTFGTGKVADEKILKAVKEVFDFRPFKIIEQLKLRRPIYRQVASYGHFGRHDLDLPWESTDKAKELKKLVC